MQKIKRPGICMKLETRGITIVYFVNNSKEKELTALALSVEPIEIMEKLRTSIECNNWRALYAVLTAVEEGQENILERDPLEEMGPAVVKEQTQLFNRIIDVFSIFYARENKQLISLHVLVCRKHILRKKCRKTYAAKHQRGQVQFHLKPKATEEIRFLEKEGLRENISIL